MITRYSQHGNYSILHLSECGDSEGSLIFILTSSAMEWSGIGEAGSPERIVFQMSSEREREQKINQDSDILKRELQRK